MIALAGAASFAGGDYALSLVRLEIGALFLGAVTDAMLLGHWYLVQPGLGRDPIKELVKIVAVLWPLELIVWLIPTGMVSVLNGSIDDGYDGLIGWMWIVASITTIGLVIATWFALKERQYSAVMAATGLLYLAILTGFGMDLLPRLRARPVLTGQQALPGNPRLSISRIAAVPSTLSRSRVVARPLCEGGRVCGAR